MHHKQTWPQDNQGATERAAVRFFALTVAESIYELSEEFDAHGQPLVKLVHPKAPDFRLEGGTMVGITCDNGIVLYHPSQPTAHSHLTVPTDWGDRTATVAALFLHQSAAEDCLKVKPCGEQWDRRWRPWTRQVLRKIGRDHPLFVISNSLPFDW